MTVGSLFAGIGGFDLGFERAGFEIKWQVEIDPYAQRVLAKHWPDVQRFGDVRTVHAARECRDRATLRHGRFGCVDCLTAVDVLCGGFPCQDISVAGKGEGIDGERSGLWREFDRLIGELRPDYVVVENVSALLVRGLQRVLGDLAASGYDAEWDCIPASAVGAPHRRDRVWIVAYPDQLQRARQSGGVVRRGQGRDGSRDGREDVADAASGTRQWWASRIFRHAALGDQISASEQWRTEPDVGRVAHGIPARVDRLRGLGNAIVPQISEWIATRIKDAEERQP